jgi:hypothetical protein
MQHLFSNRALLTTVVLVDQIQHKAGGIRHHLARVLQEVFTSGMHFEIIAAF